MKNFLSKPLIILSVLGATTHIHAWMYEFTNHTDHTIAVGMRYKEDNEPLEFRIIEPNATNSFKPGDPGISAWKKTFVADQFYYLKNPPTITETNKSTVEWEDVSITWLSPDTYQEALTLSDTNKEQLTTLLITADQADIQPTMAQSRHFGIIEDGDGTIRFISPL